MIHMPRPQWGPPTSDIWHSCRWQVDAWQQLEALSGVENTNPNTQPLALENQLLQTGAVSKL